MSLNPTNAASPHPLGIDVTTPKATNDDGLRRGATLLGATATVGLLGAPTGGLAKRFTGILASRFGMTLACSFIVTATLKSDMLYRGWQFFASVVAASRDEKVTKGITTLFNTGVESAKNHTDPTADGDKPDTTIKSRFKAGARKVEEQGKKLAHNTAAAIDDKTKPIRDDVKRETDDIKKRLGPARTQPFEPPPLPPQQQPPLNGGMGGMVPFKGNFDASPPIGGGVRGAFDKATKGISEYAKGVADEKAKREAEFAPMREDYVAWWAEHGANGYCVNLRCRYPLKVSRGGNGWTSCPRCDSRAKAAQVRAQGTPSMPMPPPAAFITYWKKHQAVKETQ